MVSLFWSSFSKPNLTRKKKLNLLHLSFLTLTWERNCLQRKYGLPLVGFFSFLYKEDFALQSKVQAESLNMFVWQNVQQFSEQNNIGAYPTRNFNRTLVCKTLILSFSSVLYFPCSFLSFGCGVKIILLIDFYKSLFSFLYNKYERSKERWARINHDWAQQRLLRFSYVTWRFDIVSIERDWRVASYWARQTRRRGVAWRPRIWRVSPSVTKSQTILEHPPLPHP